MKQVIIITSYNRYDSLIKLIDTLISQKFDGDIVVSDDNSTDVRYLTLNEKYPKIKIIRNDINNGRLKYWKTINQLFAQIKDKDFDYLIQLDDDFIICNNFINEIMSTIKEIKTKFGAMSLHLNNENDLTGNRWGLGTKWVDGGTIYTKEAMESLNYLINDTNPPTHKLINGRLNSKENRRARYAIEQITNTDKSSGVWRQVSERLRQLNFDIIKPKQSFLKHEDDNKSVMHPKHRLKNPINSYNFLDNE